VHTIRPTHEPTARMMFRGIASARPAARWTAGRAARRAWEVLREEGVRSLVFKVLGETVYRRALVFERTLDEAGRAPVSMRRLDGGRTIGTLEPGDLDPYLALAPDADPEEVLGRLREGRVAVVVRRGAAIEHATWLATGSAHIDYLDRRVRLAADEGYVYGVRTAASARRRGLSIAAADEVAAWAAASGLRRLRLVVMPENRAAAAAAPRWGYRRVGAARTLRLGRWRWHLGWVGGDPGAAGGPGSARSSVPEGSAPAAPSPAPALVPEGRGRAAPSPAVPAAPWTRLRWTAFTARHALRDPRLPWRPLSAVLAIQARRARALAAHAWESVPAVREAMEAAGMEPGDVRTADDLWALPRVTGDDLLASPERFASSRFRDGDVLALRSSGTGGRPKTVRYDPAALFLALAQGQRQRAVFARFVGRRGGFREMNAQRADSVGHQLRRFWEERSWVPRGVDLERSWLPMELGFEAAHARIEAERPHVLQGYGSYLGALYRWAIERGRKVHRPRLIWYGADRMADADRELIERELGVPVVSTYQADEALRIGFQCDLRQGFHLFVDAVAVRVVDDAGREVGPGESGRILISNLTNRATVLLNYELGDVVTVGRGPCPCGRSLPTIERIEGRADDALVLPDGEERHSIPVVDALQGVPGVVRVQVVQESLERFEIRTVCAAGTEWGAAARGLERALRGFVGEAAGIRVERVEAIAPEPGGKVRGVVSRCRRAR